MICIRIRARSRRIAENVVDRARVAWLTRILHDSGHHARAPHNRQCDQLTLQFAQGVRAVRRGSRPAIGRPGEDTSKIAVGSWALGVSQSFRRPPVQFLGPLIHCPIKKPATGYKPVAGMLPSCFAADK